MYIFLIGLSASITLLLSPSISCLSLFFFDFSWLPIDEGDGQACMEINAMYEGKFTFSENYGQVHAVKIY